MAYCFDCETAAIGPLCRSCRDHRADGHPPTQYEQINLDPLTGKEHVERWYCHGAGPTGITLDRLHQSTHPLELHELASSPQVEAVAG